jgi:hypothetical protein
VVPSTISHWHFVGSTIMSYSSSILSWYEAYQRCKDDGQDLLQNTSEKYVEKYFFSFSSIMNFQELLMFILLFTCTPKNSCSSEKRNPIRSSIFIFLDIVFIGENASWYCDERYNGVLYETGTFYPSWGPVFTSSVF